MDFLNELLKSLTEIIPTLSVSVKLGIIGGILMLILFLICFGISHGGNIAKYTKLLIAGSKKFAEIGTITDENVGIVYDELQKHPEPVHTGWQVFLDQRVGVPSDYFPARNVLTAREYNGKRTLGKSLFLILGTIVWVLIGLIGYYYYTSYSVEGFDSTLVTDIILALEFLIIPIGTFIIFSLSLDIVYGKKAKRLGLAYASFCETLDACVVVTDKEEDAFVSDNLAEINKRVEELVAGRLDDEVIEVISVPKDSEPDGRDIPSVEDVLRSMGIVDDAVQQPAATTEEAQPEVVQPEQPVELTPEELERQRFLENALENEEFVRYALANADRIHEWARGAESDAQPAEKFTFDWVEKILHITEDAIQDPNADPGDLEDLGSLLETALNSVEDETCKEALTDYLGKLATKYYSIVEG